MKRQIIKIDEAKCDGCGACATACHEGAIEIVNGKARLVRDDFCDGLGNCLPVCHVGAISFEEREAAAYDENAVKAAKQPLPCGCPGSRMRTISRNTENVSEPEKTENASCTCENKSELCQWPVQIKLVPPNAPYFDGANLLVAADCTAFAYGNFHKEFIKKHIVVVGCPKLDDVDYTEKLSAIIANNNIKSVTVVRMEVPCCGGIEHATIDALKASGKFLPWQVVTISIDGKILD